MILTNLILPLIVIALGLLMVDNKKYLFLLAISSIMVTVFFMVSYTITDSYDELVFITNFTYPLYSMVLLFCVSFILGVSFVLAQKDINYKELGTIVLYFPCSIGVLFAENFIELIIYWELLSLTATLVILASTDKDKKYVALKYFVIHALGGVMLVAGTSDFVRAFGSDVFPIDNALSLTNLGNLLILGGILINLALPPFSSWLVDGYSKCSPNASIFLSIFTTKSALFVLLKLFYGSELLIYVGIFIASYGLIFSLLETSIRRILSMAIIQQLGIIIIAIGSVKTFDGFIITYITVNVLYKIIIFMLAVILIKRYGTDNIYELKNSINLRSILGISLLITSLQAVGLPLTGGFIVKNYLISTISSLSLQWLDYLMIILLTGVALNKITYYIINFKSTSNKIIVDSYSKKIVLLIAIFLLEGVFISHSTEYFEFSYLLHSFEFIALGIGLFIISALLLNTKEDKIREKINNLKSFSASITLDTLSYMSSDKPMSKLNKYSSTFYFKLVALIKNTNNLSSRNMITWILILFILLYISLRFHQL
jgi:multicomponent Na+:H+ antiporter subunit D